MNDTAETPPRTDAAHLTTLLRGALARACGDADDAWTRVILEPQPQTGPAAARMRLPEPELDDQGRRAAFRHALAALPATAALLDVESLGTLSVIRESPTPALPLRGKIALVTGAAGAIGSGVAQGLLEKGCRVAVTDVSSEGLDRLRRELHDRFGARVMAARMDVADPESVRLGFDAVAMRWGGMDIVVVNAGIAAVSPLHELTLDMLRSVARVNTEGAFLTLSEAGRRLRRQGTGGDIVMVSTKNVFAPGAQFGAYSATKAAGHQLARIAALEYAGDDIRVNMVAPDAVFGEGSWRSGLWAEVGPRRMRARGLDEQGLEDYYRSRNLLQARVTPRHVANAVLFFVTRQTPTTGATIPVDGGLPDATPR